MIYKFQTSRSIWKFKAYKSYLWAFFKNDCLLFKSSLLLSLWIVRQENQSSLFLYFLSLFFSSFLPTCVLFVTKKWSPYVCFFFPFLFKLFLFLFLFFWNQGGSEKLPLCDPFSLFIIFLKLIFKMNLPRN